MNINTGMDQIANARWKEEIAKKQAAQAPSPTPPTEVINEHIVETEADKRNKKARQVAAAQNPAAQIIENSSESQD